MIRRGRCRALLVSGGSVMLLLALGAGGADPKEGLGSPAHGAGEVLPRGPTHGETPAGVGPLLPRPILPGPLDPGGTEPDPLDPQDRRFRPRGPRSAGGPQVCAGGARALAGSEAEALVRAAAEALSENRLSAAVVDRQGRPLAIYQKPRGTPLADADLAVGLARTGAFFSNDQAPLSSRTVRFVSGVHFPPGIQRTPNAALYGIENTNRGCDLNVSYLGGQALPPARSVVNPGRCDVDFDTGCGTGPVTGKNQPFDDHPPGAPGLHAPAAVPVNPGGLPIYRGSSLVGGIGVFAPDAPSDHAEFAALTAFGPPGLSPLPQPLPAPGVVFIDGIRLPFVRQVDRPAGSSPGSPQGGPLLIGPLSGRCAPGGWLAGPAAGNDLAAGEVDQIITQSVAAAERTRAVIRLPLGSRARMVFAVSDLDGEILGLFRMADATVFSVDVAVAKARNVVWFSQGNLPGVPPGTAVTNRTIGFGAQPMFPVGIDGTAPGPFFGLFRDDYDHPCREGFDPASRNRNGVVFFAGSIPLYVNGRLVGGLGVSGDGVEQDDYVAFLGAAGFRPPEASWADRVVLRGVRLPFLKFPRNPEG
ncbi:MAG: heme-binding protein [Acidobacteriota bacterium]